jgi:hypothetical protein
MRKEKSGGVGNRPDFIGSTESGKVKFWELRQQTIIRFSRAPTYPTFMRLPLSISRACLSRSREGRIGFCTRFGKPS